MWLPVLPPAGAFAELAVLFGVIHLANVIAPDLDILNLEPSPYWLPILLLSLQYGTVAGLLAAVAATFAHVMGGLPEQNIDEHHFAYLLRVWSLPILWIAVSLVLGQFRLRQIELKQRYVDGLTQRTKEANALTGYVHDLERRCRELERHITSSGTQGGGGVLDALTALGTPGSDLQDVLERLCQAAFPNAQLSVYAVLPAALEAVFAAGGTVSAARRIASDHSLYRAVVSERQHISVLDAAGEKALGGEGLAAVPIVHDETGRVIGILKLDRAGSEVLTSNITARLMVTASLISPMLSEPRIVVDNTAERAGTTIAAHRLLRKRRHFGWHPAESVPPGGERSPSRPRVQK